MQYFYLISSVVFLASTSIIGSFYNRKNKDKNGISAIYNVLLLSVVFLCWLILFLSDRTFNLRVIPYALLFAFCYTICNIGLINALKTGPVLLTSLLCQLSLIFVSIWGFFFWDVPFTWMIGIGLGLAAVALWLCLNNGKNKGACKISATWLGYATLALMGNAGCSIVQRTQQIQFNGQYGNFLMVVATGISMLVCFVLYLYSDKADQNSVLKGSWYYPVIAGILNTLLNLFVIFLATSTISPSLIYPVLAIGSLMITTLFSLLVFKEKMYWWQWVGVLIGVLATGILSI